MADPVEVVDAVDRKKQEAAAAEMWSQLMANRQNSVLKTANVAKSSTPVDVVTTTGKSSGVAQSIAEATQLRQIAAQQHRVEVRHEVLEARQTADRQADDVKAQFEARAQQVAIHRTEAQIYRQQESYGGGYSAQRARQDAAALLTSRGKDLLKDAGRDPSKIQDALDLLAKSGLEPEEAEQVYKAAFAMAQKFGLDVTLAVLQRPQPEAQTEAEVAEEAAAPENPATAAEAAPLAESAGAMPSLGTPSTGRTGSTTSKTAPAKTSSGKKLTFVPLFDGIVAPPENWNITPVKT